MSELIIINKGDEVESDTLNFNFQCLDEKVISVNQRIETVNASVKSVSSSVSTISNSNILDVLNTIYPVGSLFISTTNTCPIAKLFGTWEKVSAGRVLQGATEGQTAGSTVNAKVSITIPTTDWGVSSEGAGEITRGKLVVGSGKSETGEFLESLASSGSNRTVTTNTVQPPAYLVNIWKRTA